MNPDLKRFLNFVKRTGDHLILLDPETKDPYVILPFEKYEMLLGDTVKISHSLSVPPPLQVSDIRPDPLSEDDREEAEAEDGVATELVEIPDAETESDTAEEGKYYFEDFRPENEEGKKTKILQAKTKNIS